jgi:hypothetical protein
MSIKKYLTTYLKLISLLLVLTSCSTIFRNKMAKHDTEDTKKQSVLEHFHHSHIQLKTSINYKKVQISGITIIKSSGDTVNGVFINEFGVKGFEFRIIKDRCKVTRVMKVIDKWYIKSMLSSDLFNIFKKKYSFKNVEGIQTNLDNENMKFINDSTFVYTNIKWNVKYEFNLLDN